MDLYEDTRKSSFQRFGNGINQSQSELDDLAESVYNIRKSPFYQKDLIKNKVRPKINQVMHELTERIEKTQSLQLSDYTRDSKKE